MLNSVRAGARAQLALSFVADVADAGSEPRSSIAATDSAAVSAAFSFTVSSIFPDATVSASSQPAPKAQLDRRCSRQRDRLVLFFLREAFAILSWIPPGAGRPSFAS